MLHGQMLHGQMLHGQMLHGQMVLGHLSTVKDGSTNLKCPLRCFLGGEGVGVGGEKLKLLLSQPSTAGTGLSWNWAELGKREQKFSTKLAGVGEVANIRNIGNVGNEVIIQNKQKIGNILLKK